MHSEGFGSSVSRSISYLLIDGSSLHFLFSISIAFCGNVCHCPDNSVVAALDGVYFNGLYPILFSLNLTNYGRLSIAHSGLSKVVDTNDFQLRALVVYSTLLKQDLLLFFALLS